MSDLSPIRMARTEVALVFPHQLFRNHPAIREDRPVVLVEDPWFFRRFRFHKQKLVLHRASMQAYREHLEEQGYSVLLLKSHMLPNTREIFRILRDRGVLLVHLVDVLEHGLEEEIGRSLQETGIERTEYESPMFFCTRPYLREYYKKGQRFYLTSFYIDQRKRHNYLLTDEGKPVGGRWTYDTLNRKRLPADLSLPSRWIPPQTATVREAIRSVEEEFPENYGTAEGFSYPVTHEDVEAAFQDFLDHRLERFGPYEDAIHAGDHVLFHSLLTPALNIGLIAPQRVIEMLFAHARLHRFHLPSLEGFVRQVTGWREFIRAVYLLTGEEQRRSNFWNHTRPVPETFWKANTGIPPLDATLEAVLRTGFTHHIERLMVLGNFLLLTETDPANVYRWFMELFIDAYDWVMIPNVYGMSQFADGGIMNSKPYLSGSHYLLNMSNHPRGEWCDTWDALFWRFVQVHRDYFSRNPRTIPMVRLLDRMEENRSEALLAHAESYLASL